MKLRGQTGAWRFIFLQAFLLTLSAGVYIALHAKYPARETYPAVTNLIQIDSYGRATVISAEDMDWFVGSAKSVPLLSQMDVRNKEIQARVQDVRQELQDFAAQFSEEALEPIRTNLEAGDISGAVHALSNFRITLAPGSETVADTRLLTSFSQTLRELDELKQAQTASMRLMLPPEKFLLFWASPWGVVSEVVFWSLFGLFGSLLYHSARFARRSEFREAETYVGWTKLFYTPIIGTVVVLGLGVGFFQMGNIVTRVWVIPLIGVLVGFNSRKAAKLIDASSQWTLGRLADSFRGPKQGNNTPPSQDEIARALLPPDTFPQLADQMKVTAGQMLADKLNPASKTT